MVALGVGGHRSGLGGAEGPRDHQTMTAQLPRPTCTHGVVTLVGGADGGGVGSQGKAWEAGHWNVMNGLGCYCCGSDCGRFRGALGRRPRWAAVGLRSVGLARGEHVTFATNGMGHWQAVGLAGHRLADQ